MSANLPLDANIEDVLQRGLRRPSIDDVPLPLANGYQALQSSYDNFASGTISRDNIWPTREVEDLRQMTSAQRRDYLVARGVIPDAASVPDNIELPAVDQLVENALNESTGNFSERITNLTQELDAAIQNGVPVQLDSYGQPLVGPTTQPRPVTGPPPGGSYNPVGVQPNSNSNSPYTYTTTDLYVDRYDFLTGKKIYKGIASGTGGGTGSEEGNTAGAVGIAPQQTETQAPPANVGPNDTSTEQYDDAILREARQEENAPQGTASQGTATSRLDGKDGDLYSPKPEGRLSNRLDSKGETPPPPPPPKLSSKLDTKGSHRASRQEIIASRRQSGSDIKFARANGETLVRHRRPDGTYYAGPPKNVSNKQLPQRYKDF